MARRDYKTGSIYQRSSDGRWMGTIEAGWSAEGTRRRVTVSGKTRVEVVKKIRDKGLQIERDGLPAANARATVKTWASTWLSLKETTLRPKAYAAARSPIQQWIVPTIGHRRLDLLTPGDVRAVTEAQRRAGRAPSYRRETVRLLVQLLTDAVVEGHTVPQRILHTKMPPAGTSDRTAMTLDEALACLAIAGQMPNGVRWLLACWYGVRQAETLGLVRDCIEPDRIRLEWQLQDLPYVDRQDKAAGFRVPDGFEARQLVDAWHLTRPKSKKGIRVLPLHEAVRHELDAWLANAPENPWDLAFPGVDKRNGRARPMRDEVDRAEWHEIQRLAGVAHPSGRPYHVHECRNFAATMLDEVGASENVITSLLGHASIVTSRGYMTVHEGPKRDAVEALSARLLRP
ncbi:MAG: tyrosine-type recombinase/integrase [Nocardioidaceae bacterium]|nr:tyrosine-type recombinase/integrase [Nocardioidaceae bacterium]